MFCTTTPCPLANTSQRRSKRRVLEGGGGGGGCRLFFTSLWIDALESLCPHLLSRQDAVLQSPGRQRVQTLHHGSTGHQAGGTHSKDSTHSYTTGDVYRWNPTDFSLHLAVSSLFTPNTTQTLQASFTFGGRQRWLLGTCSSSGCCSGPPAPEVNQHQHRRGREGQD